MFKPVTSFKPISLSRRQFSQLLGMGIASAMLGGCASSLSLQRSVETTPVQWMSADEIKAATRVPVFPQQTFPVEGFGAVADGVVDCTAAIAAAIHHCHQAGGGRVLLGEGVYRSGPVHLLSNVELHVATGAELSFIPEPQRYLPPVFTRWEGMEMMGYSPLIYAYQQTNVAVTGSGHLNGNADNNTWWPWKGAHKERHWDYIPDQNQKPARDELFRLAESGVPVEQRQFAEGSFLRPSFIQFYQCQQVLIEGVTIEAAPFWLVHPVLCEDVTVRGVTCSSHGPNSDGCDPESCNRVVIEDCIFDTGDDCIAIKSGRNNDGRRLNVPSQNILIQNCSMHAGHGGIVLGSEISGGVKNLHARNCHMSSPELERAIRIKTNAARGGVIEHIRYENIQVGRVQDAIVVNFYYEEGEAGAFLPTVKDVEITGLQVDNANRVFVLRGFPNNPVAGLKLNGVDVRQARDLGIIENVSDLQLHEVTVNGASLSADELLRV